MTELNLNITQKMKTKINNNIPIESIAKNNPPKDEKNIKKQEKQEINVKDKATKEKSQEIRIKMQNLVKALTKDEIQELKHISLDNAL